VPDIVEGCALAQAMTEGDDEILVCGSFQTVGPALEWLRL
jgi:folylpolyglutamate synthase/dihydropteroate synthase